MTKIKFALTAILASIGVLVICLSTDNQVLISLSGFVNGTLSYLFSDWFVDWVKENV
ncbi:TMhelix containing protein [Vibrio phage 2.095.A._10N.286.46.E10]|nr:TMhelix containing protein [Vibrio phage 2.095.A._10N.286.46.E10]AUS02167.1 TMhelix containing protein [Vibrio phage 2.095.B._10N.286.46.E10]